MQRARAFGCPLVIERQAISSCDGGITVCASLAKVLTRWSVAGAKDQYIKLVFLSIDDEAFVRSFANAMGLGLDECDVRSVEDGEIFIVEARPKVEITMVSKMLPLAETLGTATKPFTP